MTECSLFRQVYSFWRKLITRSENTTGSTEHSPWEAKSHPFSTEMSCLSWNPKVLSHIHKNLPQYHILKHKTRVHIFILSSIRSPSLFTYNLCPISHMSSLPLSKSCLKFLYVFTYKNLFSASSFPCQSITQHMPNLSMPVNNTTHAQNFHASQ